MTRSNTSLIRKTTLFLAAAMLSVSAMAAESVKLIFPDVNQTQRLASQGNMDAQCLLGALYSIGQGVPQDYSKAAQWYEKSANQGSALAQFNIGYMYEQGQGVRQNVATAKEWFGLSCDNGDQGGCDEYKRLNQQNR